MDDLDMVTPNCPDCLEPMQPRAAWWFCQACHVYVDVMGQRIEFKGPDLTAEEN